MPQLFDPVSFGDIACANRVIMAPMTRSRAPEGDAPDALMAEYYAQRAGAGLIITEGVYPSYDGKGYVRTPGIVSPEQIKGWKAVTDAVHAKGGKIVCQIMHCGRIASRHNKPDSARTLAPSAIQAQGEIYTDAAGMVAFDAPDALSLDEIAATIADYGQAARNAMEAGFDGAELHCTRYGGSLENRLRFVLEVLETMTGAAGAGRVGIRICPGNPFNDLQDDDPEETFAALLKAINPMGLAYLHVIRMEAGVDNIALANLNFDGPIILNDSYTLEQAQAALSEGEGDAVSFGRPYVANPDLAERFKEGAELARPNYKLLYTPGPEGYTDYPALGEG